jgi:hypothetical protein
MANTYKIMGAGVIRTLALSANLQHDCVRAENFRWVRGSSSQWLPNLNQSFRVPLVY